MCLERLEPRREDIEDSSRRQHWCNKVLSVRTPLEAMMAKTSLLGEFEKIPFGEKRKAILTECRFVFPAAQCYKPPLHAVSIQIGKKRKEKD